MKRLWKENKTVLMLALLDFVLVTGTGFYFGCKIWQIIPLWVSVVVMFLQTRVNRYAFILGGCNSVWYAVVNVTQGLYATAAYTILFSTSLQFISFWNWNRRAYKNSTYLRVLSGKYRLLLGIGFAVTWGFMFAVFAAFGSPYMVLDNTVSVLGICCSLLLLFSFVEGYAVNLVCGLCTISMYLQLILDRPDQMPYLVAAVYSTICVAISMRNAYRLYKEQNRIGTCSN